MDWYILSFSTTELTDLSPKVQRKVYKYCFVPYCKNTTVTTPRKEFLCVPRDEERRQAWFTAAGCPEKKLRGAIHCCEDHFDLKEDLENYMKYKMMGCRKRLKPNTIPRFFFNHCQDPLAISNEHLLESNVNVKEENFEDIQEQKDIDPYKRVISQYYYRASAVPNTCSRLQSTHFTSQNVMRFLPIPYYKD